MAHDWGHLGRQVLGGFLGGMSDPAPAVINVATPWETSMGFGGPGMTPVPSGGGGMVVPAGVDCETMPWTGGTPPKGYKVVNYCGQGVLRRIRRRRRRRILTASDQSDIAAIVGLVGKGQMASALINRTRS